MYLPSYLPLIALISFISGAWSVDMFPARRELGPVTSLKQQFTSIQPQPSRPALSEDSASGFLLWRPDVLSQAHCNEVVNVDGKNL